MKDAWILSLNILLASSLALHAGQSTPDSNVTAVPGFYVGIELEDTLFLEYEPIFATVYIINRSDSARWYNPSYEVNYHLLSASGTEVPGCGLWSLPHTSDYLPVPIAEPHDTVSVSRKRLTSEFGPAPHQLYCIDIPIGDYRYFGDRYPSDTVRFRVGAPTSDVDIVVHRLIKAGLEAGKFTDGSSNWSPDDQLRAVFLDSALALYRKSSYRATVLDLVLSRGSSLNLSERQQTEFALELMRTGKPNYALSASMFLRMETLSVSESAWVRTKVAELRQVIGRGDGSYNGYLDNLLIRLPKGE